MKCFVCKNEEDYKPNYFLPIFVLLGFYCKRLKRVDQFGYHYAENYVFTPIGKTTMEGYCCPSCNSKLFKKYIANKKRSKIIGLIILILTFVFNFMLYKNILDFLSYEYVYIFNVSFLIIGIICLYYIITDDKFLLYDYFKKDDSIKDNINLLSEKIDLSTINFYDLDDHDKSRFINNKMEMTYEKGRDLLFVMQKCQFMRSSYSIGQDGERVWFITSYKSYNYFCLDNRLQLQLTSIQISKDFKHHLAKNKEVIGFSNYKNIKEL